MKYSQWTCLATIMAVGYVSVYQSDLRSSYRLAICPLVRVSSDIIIRTYYDYDGNPYYSHRSKCRSPVAWSRDGSIRIQTWDICSQPLLMRAHRRQQRAGISLVEVETFLRNFFHFFAIYVRLLDSTYIFYIKAYTTTISYSLIVIMAVHFPSHFRVEFCFLYINMNKSIF